MIKADNITKLPRGMNPNEMIMRKMDEKYSVCPFCRENKKINSAEALLHPDRNGVYKSNSSYWYGKQTDSLFSIFKFWEKNFHWRVDFWKCNTCGAEWKTEPYPTDAIEISEAIKNFCIEKFDSKEE